MCITWGVDAPAGRGTFEISCQLKSIVKRRILVVGLNGELCKNGWIYLNGVYIV